MASWFRLKGKQYAILTPFNKRLRGAYAAGQTGWLRGR